MKTDSLILFVIGLVVMTLPWIVVSGIDFDAISQIQQHIGEVNS